jgi:uncharacterized protein YdeI (YjbR/CyaY-like superfamily)
MPEKSTNPLSLKNQQDWRLWLEENYSTSGGVWIVLKKKNSKAIGVTYQEALDEALCFGWIDGVMRSGDAETFLQRFTPRRRGSIWSKRNRDRVPELINEGLMTEAGLKAVDDAKTSGKWDTAYTSKRVTIPGDLLKALEGNPLTYSKFMSSSDSMKLRWVYWLNEAKKSETRLRRIGRILDHHTKPT